MTIKHLGGIAKDPGLGTYVEITLSDGARYRYYLDEYNLKKRLHNLKKAGIKALQKLDKSASAVHKYQQSNKAWILIKRLGKKVSEDTMIKDMEKAVDETIEGLAGKMVESTTLYSKGKFSIDRYSAGKGRFGEAKMGLQITMGAKNHVQLDQEQVIALKKVLKTWSEV